MKKIILSGCLILFLSTMVFAQDKIEAPVWNVGDKWVFTRDDTMEVIDADQTSYVVKHSGMMFEKKNRVIVFYNKTLKKIYIMTQKYFLL